MGFSHLFSAFPNLLQAATFIPAALGFWEELDPPAVFVALSPSDSCILQELLSSAVAASWQGVKPECTVCGIYKQPVIPLPEQERRSHACWLAEERPSE